MASSSNRSSLAVLCVHGAGAGGWEWNQWSRVIAARGLAVSAPDLQPVASGLAQTRFEDYRMQVADSARQLAQAGDAALVLVGASLGGLLALSVAVDVHAAALVLINPMPPVGIVAKPLGKAYPALVPWGQNRSIASTRRAMPDADDAACLFAFRRWRDESGLALEQARLGIQVEFPRCPVLVMASQNDNDIPIVVSRALATRSAGEFEVLHGCSHTGPLLGADAAGIAGRTVDWMIARTAAHKLP
ncbi:alpha/beta hydrolase [Dokdonella sp.]|uniref:alpha/beta hydrolase n=1 Tax=Dokdonella sp. TaxID=2291710 RepID=UPI003C63CE22